MYYVLKTNKYDDKIHERFRSSCTKLTLNGTKLDSLLPLQRKKPSRILRFFSRLAEKLISLLANRVACKSLKVDSLYASLLLELGPPRALPTFCSSSPR